MGQMLRRLLLALLTLCLALPALAPVAAMPHAQVPMADAHHEHHGQAPMRHDQGSPHAGKHECIGCAAPLDRSPVALGEPLPAADNPPPSLAAPLPETRAGPEVPPPRA